MRSGLACIRNLPSTLRSTEFNLAIHAKAVLDLLNRRRSHEQSHGLHEFYLPGCIVRMGADPPPRPALLRPAMPEQPGGIMDYWWVILLIIIVVAAIWYFSRRGRNV